MHTFLKDLHYGLRTLVQAPTFTGVTVLTLALAIGANTIIFSIASFLLLRPLPFDDPDRLVIAWQQDAQGDLREVSYREFPGWRDQARSFAAMTALGSVNWSFETSGSHGVST